ncbi:hypothetical protein FLAG1_07120 [Fusarium langsethiae]|uniref:H-type lectin domain-containing protein n=1 Tax=Fusarium langsethiae TaxID=179993 RepID=A0A0N0V6D0_FUSLA|nr:hypothetical protein FLAG1_07120 [Fusarium langsethiae]GKU04421.1 unnamed protein product [Fusarium langsethiae]
MSSYKFAAPPQASADLAADCFDPETFDPLVPRIVQQATTRSPILLPWQPRIIPLGMFFRSNIVETAHNPFAPESAFSQDSLESARIIFTANDSSCTYRSPEAFSSSSSMDHLSVSMGASVDMTCLEASVSMRYDKDVLENRDSNKASVTTSYRAGSVRYARSPELSEAAFKILTRQGVEGFKSVYGDYYVGGYRIGGDAAVLFSTDQSSYSETEKESVQIKVESWLGDYDDNWSTSSTSSSGTAVVRINAFSTLEQLIVAKTVQTGTPEFQAAIQLGRGIHKRAQGLEDGVAKVLGEVGVRHGKIVSPRQCTQLCQRAVVVELQLVPIECLRQTFSQLQRYSSSNNIFTIMSLLLAPYNNGMRLGQGFNSYTQQICIDDAVVIDPDRVDNSVTNDGFTMRELRHAIGARAGGEDYDDEEDYGDAIDALPEASALPAIQSTGTEITANGTDKPAGVTPSAIKALDTVAIQLREDAKTVEKLVSDVASLETLIEEAIDLASAETKRNILLLEKKRMRLARIKTNGTGLKGKKLRGTVKALSQRGPSQIVTYSSRFVNKISEITDDMNISGSLSIKYGSIGGAGKGSFVDSDKFKESDLNFFISVKVINQSINIKDALVFQGLPSVDQSNFRSVFGDCYIAGFLEGGEFNALVSMKVVNKAKAMSIKAEAEVALSVGAVDLKATAKVDIDKSNFSSQTETTIQVGWSGGGHIKPMDQPWTIQSLMETAARFPDLVASTPQRTYAILTKYESLRSFMALKPPSLTPMYYENASIYTNALLDAYMDYKNANPWNGDKKELELTTSEDIGENKIELPFEASIKGLDLARRACRFQMIKIVNEVDAVEKNPGIAANEKRPEAYQSTIVFRERIPLVVDKEKLPHLKIFGTEEAPPKLIESTKDDGMQESELTKANSYLETQPDVGVSMRLAPLVGSAFGAMFCNLDFVKAEFSLRTVSVEVEKGVVVAISVRYANGLQATMGTPGGSHKVSLTLRPSEGQKIIACSIETGRRKDSPDATTRVTALRLYTNRGPDLEGHAKDWVQAQGDTGMRDGIEFKDLKLVHFDPLLVNAHVKGFWGHAKTTNTGINPTSGVYRLAPIWGNKEDTTESGDSSMEADMSLVRTQPEQHLINCRERLGWTGGIAGRSAVLEQSFYKPLPFIPTVIYGFRHIDVAHTDSPRVALTLPSVTEWGFSLGLKSFLHSTWNLEANVMVLPNGVFPFQHGFVDASDNPGGRKATENASIHVTFAKPFTKTPKVAVWFTEIHQPKGHRSLMTHVVDASPTGMRINIETWAGREFDNARVAYLAYPDGSDYIKGGSSDFGPKEDWRETEWPGGPFKKEPNVFTAINYFDIGVNDNTMDILVTHQTASSEKLRYCGWGSNATQVHQISMCWIGISC